MGVLGRLQRMLGGKPATDEGVSMNSEHSKLLDELISEVVTKRRHAYYDFDLKEKDCGKRILSLTRDEQCSLIATATSRLVSSDKEAAAYRKKEVEKCGYISSIDEEWKKIWAPRSVLANTVKALMRKKLPLTDKQLIELITWISAADSLSVYWYPFSGVVKAVETRAKDSELPEDLRAATLGLIKRLKKKHADRDLRKFSERLDDALGTAPTIMLQPGEAWSDVAIEHLQQVDDKTRDAWAAILKLCQSATAGKPTKKWLKAATPLLDKVGVEAFKSAVLTWFPLVDKPRTAEIADWPEWQPNPNMMVIDLHADILKGLVWICGTIEDKQLARTLCNLAVSAYKKVPGIGPRAVKIGNACVYALGQMPGRDAVGQLAVLKVRTRFRTAQKGIEKALNATAERIGIPREELEEMSVPAYGLTDVGLLEEEMGDFTAELRVTGTSTTQLLWRKADGKTQKSVPATVKADHADDLKDLKGAAKDIQRMLPAQRERLDGLFLAEKTWPLATWRERYLDHPLVGTLARRLIWCFSEKGKRSTGIFLDGKLVDQKGEPLESLEADTEVSLWHPIDRELEEIIGWREWLEQHQVQQPFKQAHRELYLLTDAERTTEVYSNRYAAHIVRQHQFNALCAARGWHNVLKLLVDDEFPPASRALPKWGLRAEFWTDGAGEDYGTDTNDTGTFYYLATDQVRFFPIGAPQATGHASGHGQAQTVDPLPLTEIPPLVFSEIMRDIDLFVGVASVGNDPTWADGGPDGRYQGYWHSYSFGDLSASAKTRREVLERLVPKLKISSRASFSDKFLVVKGDVRTYKIHLGSGNILMEPNDEYLCIVPSRGAAKGPSSKVFLPFEGDAVLSIILSKAFMLAEDKKIKDKTILNQINRQ